MGSSESPKDAGAIHERDSTETIDMALYSLHRAHATLSSLQHKPAWTLSDTASFDCMHYDGDATLDHLAAKLDLQPGQRVLDVGSGFSATGRVLCSKYGVGVTGVELQSEVHDIAEVITRKNVDKKVRDGVRSVCADFLTVEPKSLVQGDFDHVISLLCFMHLPQASRRTVFQQAARYLKPGGKLYVEDFYHKAQLKDAERQKLQKFVACSYLPKAQEYVADVEAAGFSDVEFDDVSKRWAGLLAARAKKYKACRERDADLETFYNIVAELFEGGNVGGVRLTASRSRETDSEED